MVAGFLLHHLGRDFEILEAGERYGGRMKHHTAFASFPISLGAEWLHAEHKVLGEIINRSGDQVKVETIGYPESEEFGFYAEGELYRDQIGDSEDRKFIGSSWLGFFETEVVPSIADKIRLNTEVTEIHYAAGEAKVKVRDGRSFSANQVVFTAPLQMLKRSRIFFYPELPDRKQQAIRQAEVWGGIKVFIRCKKRFYPTFLAFEDSDTEDGQRLYYDASFGQRGGENILGLFAVGEQAKPYLTRKGDALKTHILQELKQVFGSVAEESFIELLAQNWNEEPFIESAYLSDYADERLPPILAESVQETLYFAGEAYTDEGDWGGVHNAARAAHRAVNQLIRA